MPWNNGIAVGRAYELLRKDLTDHLKFIQKELGFKYCRFHAVFHDDMNVVTKDNNGNIVYQWHQVDKIYDTLLEMGLRPFIELNPMPGVLASGDQTIFKYKMNVTPPKSYAQWKDLVYNFVMHLAERYGLDEIRQWRFEVWNEPNLPCFWTGTMEDYWKLYDAAAQAIKSVDHELKVGGPASSKANWIGDIINHCVKLSVPIDFVSTHLYPQDEYVEYADRAGSPYEPGEYFAQTILSVREIVRKSPLPNLEIHWTEWNAMSAISTAAVTWTENQCVDNLYAASFIASNCIRLDEACDSLCYWTASDIFEESGMAHSPFSYTYGLVTIHGLPKASFNAFSFLKKMHGNVCDIDYCKAVPAGCGIAATAELDTTHVLLWNHKILEVKDKVLWKDTIKTAVQHNGIYEIIAAKIRKGKGSAWETWCRMGSPHNISAEEERLLRDHSLPEYNVQMCRAENGQVIYDFKLEDNEVMYLQIRPKRNTVVGKGANKAELEKWNRQLGEKSR